MICRGKEGGKFPSGPGNEFGCVSDSAVYFCASQASALLTGAMYQSSCSVPAAYSLSRIVDDTESSRNIALDRATDYPKFQHRNHGKN